MAVQSLANVFDRTGKVRRPPMLLTVREVWSLFSYYPPAPDPAVPLPNTCRPPPVEGAARTMP